MKHASLALSLMSLLLSQALRAQDKKPTKEQHEKKVRAELEEKKKHAPSKEDDKKHACEHIKSLEVKVEITIKLEVKLVEEAKGKDEAKCHKMQEDLDSFEKDLKALAGYMDHIEKLLDDAGACKKFLAALDQDIDDMRHLAHALSELGFHDDAHALFKECWEIEEVIEDLALDLAFWHVDEWEVYVAWIILEIDEFDEIDFLENGHD